ncbi:hypothetical protein XAP412_320108 [Xanthomonas phaseoli pv. phaseoli]|uniref:Uncharacterized protein n=1 Tax=Xanthomonas campestris pv. phaseoli TaxID=317013 RepID=A0AB38DZH3_XANCH|nr:hypothetical protein XAP6984_380105 [Xanthomonas phaseoli pv. phaseoli]SON83886.1 hypothetical protein XAP412_320108 [Xanthomonas phaseoli pv. phaseoli]SON88317.1 hypothetical protein XAP7430_360108 [Xanthomonas phaseoli pv. phaseoli]
MVAPPIAAVAGGSGSGAHPRVSRRPALHKRTAQHELTAACRSIKRAQAEDPASSPGVFRKLGWCPRRLTSAPASIDTVAAFRPWRDFRSSVARDRRGHHKTWATMPWPWTRAISLQSHETGGERGIRTPEARFRRLHTFQACSFNHSDTSPYLPCDRVVGRSGILAAAGAINKVKDPAVRHDRVRAGVWPAIAAVRPSSGGWRRRSTTAAERST